MATLDRRTLLTAMLGACAAASTMGLAATSASAVPMAKPMAPTGGAEEALAEVVEGEAEIHKAQFIVIGRRRRRRFIVRPRRRRRVYFY